MPASLPSGPALLFLLLVICNSLLFSVQAQIAGSFPELSSTNSLPPSIVLAFKEFCFRCHGDRKAKAHLNLRQLSANSNFSAQFNTWETVITMLEKREMPPEDEPQPTKEQRQKLISTIRESLETHIRTHAGDPGKVALRRLTSAEYAYCIQDLAGLDLRLDRSFTSDAAGGEGFSNVGDVQFIQDSTLEHYLESAKKVASHAVLGSGPLRFFPNAGKTGQELSAIDRIQEIYRRNGFRTSSGEGGEAFGLEHYPKAFYAAWQFKHREMLGRKNTTLDALAIEQGIQPRFLQYVWRLLSNPSLSFPSSQIVAAFHRLPAPHSGPEPNSNIVKTECENLFDLLQQWYSAFVLKGGDEDGPSEPAFRPGRTNLLRVEFSWPAGKTNFTFNISVQPIGRNASNPMVIWKEPTFTLIPQNEKDSPPSNDLRNSLHEIVSAETARQLGLGQHRGPSIAVGTPPGDFTTSAPCQYEVACRVPLQLSKAVFQTGLELDKSITNGAALIVISFAHKENNPELFPRSSILILASPESSDVQDIKAGVAEFARNFPQNSHREAAPSDRDPIPAPFDNTYNNPERNEFHYILKYHRDDRFLVENILDEPTRIELDHAWNDLLSSFDYHQTFLKFVARKFKLGLPPASLPGLSLEAINPLPEEPRRIIQSLRDQFSALQNNLKSAEPRQLSDILQFAQLAWRRPLSVAEEQRLRNYYSTLRADSRLEHSDAARALLTRVLLSPAFLYRFEISQANASAPTDLIPLTSWELASRLSFFLWSSIPDAELSRAASSGELTNTENLATQVKRMLRDGKARRLAAEFFGQWLGFYRFDDFRGVDTSRFPEFRDTLKNSMHEEAVAFFEHIIREDRPPHDILFADYTFLNQELAMHYGISAEGFPTNSSLRKMDGVDRFRRGGLLRLGAILTTTSAPLRTSAVKRGDWILRRILGRSVPPPPGDAGSIPPDDILNDGKTVRQRLELHRRDPSCINCHSRMDPLGFALEHFDSIGRWRESYRDGQRIDASGTLHDGTEIDGFEGLRNYLLANEDLFNRTLCAKLLGYALGRSEIASDRPLLDQMVAGLKQDNRFSTLVTQIVTSTQFRFLRAENAVADPGIGIKTNQ